MPTKPSKFATFAAKEIIERRSNLTERAMAVNKLLSAKLIDQSFAPARTAFEELVSISSKILERQEISGDRVIERTPPSQQEILDLNNALAAAQKILKEWRGE